MLGHACCATWRLGISFVGTDVSAREVKGDKQDQPGVEEKGVVEGDTCDIDQCRQYRVIHPRMMMVAKGSSLQRHDERVQIGR